MSILASLCVIKKVHIILPYCAHSDRFMQKTRGRTVQKDRFQTRRERLCLRLPPCPQFLLAISRPLYPVAIVFLVRLLHYRSLLYSANVLLPSSSTQILKCSFCLDTTSNSLLLSFDWFIVHLPTSDIWNESVFDRGLDYELSWRNFNLNK